MLQKYKTKREEGFTIIEVLIVLAIAGLILLIVFLAIPALQRNSRNTQRKNDSAALASAYSEYVNNHGGSSPTTAANVTDNAKLGFYKTSGVTIRSLTSSSADPGAAPADTDSVVVIVNAKCDPTLGYSATNMAGMVSYAPRGGVVLFNSENSGSGSTTQCVSAG